MLTCSNITAGQIHTHRASGPTQHIATLVLLIVIGLLNCYRAATQSLTIDEAYAYQRFVNQPILTSLTTYDAGHHILHTYGCILFVRIFGAGVLPLRMTSLLFGFVYLWVVWRLSALLFSSNELAFLAAALLALNPYIFDFMSAARGYGMALSLFAWAVFLSFQYCEDVKPAARVLTKIAVLATLAVGANLAFAFPVTALVAAIAVIVFRREGPGALRIILVNIALPAAAAFCLFALPLAVASSGDFYLGVGSLRATLHYLYVASFDQDWPMLGVLPEMRAPINSFLPGLLLLVAAASTLALLKPRSLSPPLALSACLLAGSVLLLAAGHRLSGMLYPYPRTCLYLVFLSTLVVLLAVCKLMRSGQPWRSIGGGTLGIIGLIAMLYVLELRTQWYGDWKFDAGTQTLMRSLSEGPRDPSGRPAHLGVSWLLQPSAEFYREIYHMDWLLPITRDEPSCEDDYVLLTFLERGVADTLSLKVLNRDHVSGSLLARRLSKPCTTTQPLPN